MFPLPSPDPYLLAWVPQPHLTVGESSARCSSLGSVSEASVLHPRMVRIGATENLQQR